MRILVAIAKSAGIGPNGSPRKSVSRPATITSRCFHQPLNDINYPVVKEVRFINRHDIRIWFNKFENFARMRNRLRREGKPTLRNNPAQPTSGINCRCKNLNLLPTTSPTGGNYRSDKKSSLSAYNL